MGTTNVAALGGQASQNANQSQVGTPGYVAPEILMGVGHDKMVDWWGVGVLLFEMIAGYTPFQGNDVDSIFLEMLSLNIEYPEWMSDEAKDLISKFLVINPKNRLGHKLNDIKKHSFFKGFDFGSMPDPPFLPKVTDF